MTDTYMYYHLLTALAFALMLWMPCVFKPYKKRYMRLFDIMLVLALGILWPVTLPIFLWYLLTDSTHGIRNIRRTRNG